MTSRPLSRTVSLMMLMLFVTATIRATRIESAEPPAARQNATTEANRQKLNFFEKRIRPILVKHCYDCHGADDPQGKLRLDIRSGWVRGGESGPSIVPGDPAASLLLRAVTYKDEKLKMPPPDEGTRLSDRQIQDLTTWIRQGAVDPRRGKSVSRTIDARSQSHWAFQPVRAPSVPAGKHPIDWLIDKQLVKAGYQTTSQATRRTLIRRATLDLHGLPPTAGQAATSEFTRLIDQLLESLRYGERWGRHWLDVARYSDAKDGVLMYGDARIRPFAYTYRDYVIRAFNQDKPFDRFVREQLAADQMGLPADSPDLAAMGLLTLGRMFDRNPHDVIDDQIDVVSRGFLGLTVSCARCHDHKFDPLPTADYYSLYGVFASSIEPYDRPRIEAVNSSNTAYENEIRNKLDEVHSARRTHYDRLLATARDRTPDYLVKVATTEPDVAETSIFFLSLLPQQLRPQITYRWRQLIARRAHADDPVFGPWHDMMLEPRLQPQLWRTRGIDPRVINGLIAAKPKTKEQIARVYGQIIRDVWRKRQDLTQQIAADRARMALLRHGSINLVDMVAGGDGSGSGKHAGKPGLGIHPVTGKTTIGEAGFIEIPKPDTLVPVPDNPYVDGVFVPKSQQAVISSTGITVRGLKPTSGKTWDYFKSSASSGFTSNTIDGIDFSKPPHHIMGLHANKGITFDLQAIRAQHDFRAGTFKTIFGHGGARGGSKLDFAVYLDGSAVVQINDFAAQQKGHPVAIALPPAARFLTLIVTEGAQGISHDQAILGDPRIELERERQLPPARQQKLAALQQNIERQQRQLAELDSAKGDSSKGDPLKLLLLSKSSPVWFPVHHTYYYLSRKDKDAFRGLVNQLDTISVKHRSAASRAMVMVDTNPLYDPVIFQRGDPVHRGTSVPRQFLQVLAGSKRKPFANGSGRLDLANAIASPSNPLTARVWVNRVWMHHFGEPLVENPSDFGLRTPRPLHAELLDYLAATFIENGWRTKPLHKLIMTSQAWQRSSIVPDSPDWAKQLEADPANRFLWRAHRRRMDLEQMRDSMLAISGKIDFAMGGRPLLIGDANNTRRTVYAFVERQNLPDVVQTFDFANADTSTARRVTTTVPQQALFSMNSTFALQTARAVAARTVNDKRGIGFQPVKREARARIEKLYQLVLGRPPSEEELAWGLSFVTSGTWEQYAQVLLMSNEFMYID